MSLCWSIGQNDSSKVRGRGVGGGGAGPAGHGASPAAQNKLGTGAGGTLAASITAPVKRGRPSPPNPLAHNTVMGVSATAGTWQSHVHGVCACEWVHGVCACGWVVGCRVYDGEGERLLATLGVEGGVWVCADQGQDQMPEGRAPLHDQTRDPPQRHPLPPCQAGCTQAGRC